jgi:hypothetical protein
VCASLAPQGAYVFNGAVKPLRGDGAARPRTRTPKAPPIPLADISNEDAFADKARAQGLDTRVTALRQTEPGQRCGRCSQVAITLQVEKHRERA